MDAKNNLKSKALDMLKRVFGCVRTHLEDRMDDLKEKTEELKARLEARLKELDAKLDRALLAAPAEPHAAAEARA